MKKILVVLLVLVNIVLITCGIYLYNSYYDMKNVLSKKLDGSNYYEYINLLEANKDKIINDIEDNIGYKFESENTFDGIKNKLNDDYEKYLLEKDNLNKKKSQLLEQNNMLKMTYNEILEEERKKNTFIISNVPKINQYSLGYPTGCESAALTNLLNYWGVFVKIGDVVKLLAKGDLPYYEDGVRYGGNPYLEFVGHPSTKNSYGVYEKPIIEVANKLKPGVIDGSGMKLSEVLQLVKEQRPVLVWVSMNMAVPYIGGSWIYKPTGEKIKWMSNEHALLVVGYNPSQVIVSDSLNGKIRYYDRGVFESRYNTYGKRAIYY